LELERRARLDRTARSFILWKALEMNGQTLADVAQEKYNANKHHWLSILSEAGRNTADKQFEDYLLELYASELKTILFSK
jgi:hypothetical protein